MTLSDDDKRTLEDSGYLLVRGLVPPDRVGAALAAINASLGRNGLPPDALPRMRAHTFCPELVEDAAILDLYRATPLAALAEAALGTGRVLPPRDAQIALRFPTPGAERVDPRPHIDGLPRALNGVAAGTIYHFTALVAVFLSDADAPFAGNFTVWPGSHRNAVGPVSRRRGGHSWRRRGQPERALVDPAANELDLALRQRRAAGRHALIAALPEKPAHELTAAPLPGAMTEASRAGRSRRSPPRGLSPAWQSAQARVKIGAMSCA